MVGRVGVEPTTLKRTDLQSAAFADSLPAHIYNGRPGWTRTTDVSYVTILQTATFAAGLLTDILHVYY